LPEKPRYRFKDSPDAMKFLLRRRTLEQISRIAANAQLGYVQARTFTWVHRNREWLLSADYLRALPELPTDLGGTETSLLTAMLSPQASLLAHGQEVFAAYHRFVQAGQQLRAAVDGFYARHPWARHHTRLRQSEQRLFCAFAMLAVESENMGPKLSPQEMEALALVVGIRLPGEEFEQDPRSNEQRQAAWREMMREVDESGVLPLLRSIAAEHRPPGEEAEPPATPPVQQSFVSPPSTPPEAAEHSKGDGGDKK
jgi:hypothetical protein